MKLIQKINLRYLTYSLFVLILLGIGIYIALRYIVNDEVDEKLEKTLSHVERLIKKNHEPILLDPFIEVEIIGSTAESKHFSDTIILDEDNEEEMFRQLIVVKTFNNTSFKIIVRESYLESDDLLETIVYLILGCLVLLFGMLFYLNMRISKSVWTPFYKNLDKLKKFSIKNTEPFLPEDTDILEFNQLNQAHQTLTDKVIKDYEILKKFSEDASHEIQTPLAVIRSKIEALLGGNQLSPIQVEKVQSIYSSVNRLSRINKDLLLLAKIENDQFSRLESISLKDSINEKMEYFAELTDIKRVQVSFEYKSDWIVNADRTLIEILLNNLFNNAIKHNHENGTIHINLENKILKISNSGTKPIERKENIFDRFYKETDTESTGLGLAISKQICQVLELLSEYEFIENTHVFSILDPSLKIL